MHEEKNDWNEDSKQSNRRKPARKTHTRPIENRRRNPREEEQNHRQNLIVKQQQQQREIEI
jgi:hypothetical protein